MQTLRIAVQREAWNDRFAVYIRARNPFVDGLEGHGIGLPLQFRIPKREDEGAVIPPAMTLSMDDAQRFIDELWRAGLRPTDGAGNAGALAATLRHLEDFRALVFKTKPKE